MRNERPADNPYMARCRDEMRALMQKYDLAGGFCLTDGQEMAYAYQMSATWNAIVDDPTMSAPHGFTPLGFRVRAKSAELGHERAQALVEGVGQTLGALLDFSRQTDVWMRDLMRMLRKAGVGITYRPFGGRVLPRLTSLGKHG